MLAGEYYEQALSNQRQTAHEQTSIINEIKVALDNSEAEQIKALKDGFDKLSKAVGNIVVNGNTAVPIQRTNTTIVQIQYCPQNIWWNGRWWYWTRI